MKISTIFTVSHFYQNVLYRMFSVELTLSALNLYVPNIFEIEYCILRFSLIYLQVLIKHRIRLYLYQWFLRYAFKFIGLRVNTMI